MSLIEKRVDNFRLSPEKISALREDGSRDDIYCNLCKVIFLPIASDLAEFSLEKAIKIVKERDLKGILFCSMDDFYTAIRFMIKISPKCIIDVRIDNFLCNDWYITMVDDEYEIIKYLYSGVD